MKALIILVIMGLIVSVVAWRFRNAQAEEALARREALKKRKNKDKQVMTPEIDMTWPVIVKPVRGEGAQEEVGDEELSMTSIDFEPSDQVAAKQGK
jgi:hypothetical protein